MTLSLRITEDNKYEIADRINEEFLAGTITSIAGQRIKSRWGQPVATAYGTGTVSVTVQARTKAHGHNDLYFKTGTTLVLS